MISKVIKTMFLFSFFFFLLPYAISNESEVLCDRKTRTIYSYRLTNSRRPVTNHSRDRVCNESREGKLRVSINLCLCRLTYSVT